MSTLKTNTIKNTDDVEMYLAKAWVNFNGQGTVAIRAAGNVSSITDNGTGDYTVNFTNAMPDDNYSTTGTTVGANGTNTACFNLYSVASSQLTNSVRVTLVNNSNASVDREYVSVTIFR